MSEALELDLEINDSKKKKNIKNAIIVHTVQRHTFFFLKKMLK